MTVMTATFFILAAAAAGLPIGAIALVSIASRREDAAWTLGGKAPGLIAAAARLILDFRSDYDGPPPRRGRNRAVATAPPSSAAQAIADIAIDITAHDNGLSQSRSRRRAPAAIADHRT